MAIYAAIFPPGDGEYEERPRDPYARGRQHKEPPQFTWEWFPVHILFCLSRLFSTFRFSFFHPSSLCLSVSLQSSTLNPHPSLFFHPCFGFYPHPVHAGAFTFDESRWNYPLHSRGQWSSSLCGVKRQREWGREGGVRGETVNHPVDICARVTKKAGDSFEAILFPTSAPLLYYYSSSSRDSMSRGKKRS